MSAIKVMISNGLRGNTDPHGYVEKCRDAVRAYYKARGIAFELIDTYFSDFNGNRLQFLGKSIMDGLAQADEVVFMDEWEKYDGCRAEHFIATQYGITCRYLSTS